MICESSLYPCAGKQTLAAVSTTWKWQTRAETDELAIAVLQLGATPPTRRRYMALAG